MTFRITSQFLVVFLVFMLGGGCGTGGNLTMVSSNSYPPLHSDAPVRITTGEIDEQYEEIAIISVKVRALSDGGLNDLNEALKAQARRVGANAVIRISYIATEGQIRDATGTAVRIAGDQ